MSQPITTLTIEMFDEHPFEEQKGSYCCRVQHWPEVGDNRHPTEYGFGATEEEALGEALEDMASRLGMKLSVTQVVERS